MKESLRQKTRQWFHDNALACIAEVEAGKIKLASHYPLEQYRSDMQERAKAALAGDFDDTFTFHQRAQWLDGQPSRALLPK